MFGADGVTCGVGERGENGPGDQCWHGYIGGAKD